MVRVGIVGLSGYVGGELLRLLSEHPQVTITYVASRQYAGRPVGEVTPAFAGCTDLVYEPVEPTAMAQRCDVVLAAVPHGVGMELAGPLLSQGCRLIDLGTDFRFSDPAEYEAWYAHEHTAKQWLAEAVYGLPELFGEQVRSARLIGNPGCYPTASLLGIAPLAQAGWVDLDHVVIAAMSGVSGAGSTPKPMYHFPECSENVQPYGVASHRHTPEIEQGIRRLAPGRSVRVSFTPHLVPMIRGILATQVLIPTRSVTQDEVQALYQEFYAGRPFVRVLPSDRLPTTKAVWGSNFCDIAVRVDQRAGKVIVTSAIDNLVKGAAGQAVQNLNLMFGLPEGAGLRRPGLYP